MTINRTTLLDLPLPVTGTESGTWGSVTNNGLTEYLDIAIAGRNALTSSDFTAGALTISTTGGDASSTNISALSAQYATLYVSSLAVNSTITAPSSNRAYRVINADSTYTLTIKATGQTGVTFPVNSSGTVVFNGTDYVLIGTFATIFNVDNLRLDGNTLSSTDTNGNIVIAPNGTGDVQVDADTLRVGDANASATITTNGTGDLVINTNSGTNAGSITLANGTNGNITLAPNGTGDVYIDADTLRVGDSNVNATITTNGTGDLILNTNAGTNSGTITIQDAANGNIVIAPNGTGKVQISGTSSNGASIEFYEDTDNGTNYVALKAADNIASNVTFTLPAADGTNGQVLQTNGSGTLSFTTPSSGISTGKSIAMALIFGF